MWRLILITFGFLGWSFYVLSGGADYQPVQRLLAQNSANVVPAAVTLAAPKPAVQRPVITLDLPRTTSRIIAASPTTNTPTDLPVVLVGLSAPDVPKPSPAAAALLPAVTSVSVPETAQDAANTPDIRTVRGTRVNLRGGPGTRFGVVSKLLKGTEVEVIRTPGNGWVKLRVSDTGRVGWMAERLVTAAAE